MHMLHSIAERAVECLILILIVLLLPSGQLGQIFLQGFRVGFLFWSSRVILPVLRDYYDNHNKALLMKAFKTAACYLCVFCLLLIFQMCLVKIDLLLNIVLLSVLMWLFAWAACSIYLCRQKQLEDILVLAKQFHETAEPISDFLSVTEKKLANSEPVGTQTAKIQQQIIRHKVGCSCGRWKHKTGIRNPRKLPAAF